MSGDGLSLSVEQDWRLADRLAARLEAGEEVPDDNVQRTLYLLESMHETVESNARLLAWSSADSQTATAEALLRGYADRI